MLRALQGRDGGVVPDTWAGRCSHLRCALRPPKCRMRRGPASLWTVAPSGARSKGVAIIWSLSRCLRLPACAAGPAARAALPAGAGVGTTLQPQITLGSGIHAAACAGRLAASSVSYSEVSQSGQCGPVASSAHTPVSYPPQRHSAEPPPAAQPLPPGLGWGQSCRRGLGLLLVLRHTFGHCH